MRYLFTAFILFLTLSFSYAEDGIKFFKGTFEEAKELAAKEHKIIFMDAYTSWCGPCKRMARDVFTQEEVGKFYNKHFINIKVDMEKGEGPKIAQKYRVNSYPTFLFLDEKGEIVHQAKGGRPADQFIGIGRLALNKNDKSEEYAKKYEKGERSPEFLRAYAYALLKSAKPNLKIANEYIRTQKDFSDKENLEFLFDFANEADSKVFETMIDNKDAIIKLKTERAYQERVLEACNATVQKAVEFKVDQLVSEAKDKMKAANPKFAKEYGYIADMRYAMALENLDDYAQQADKYLKKYAKKDATKWHKYAKDVLYHTNERSLLEKAEKWAKQATTLDYKADYLKTHAGILQKLGKTDEALKLIEKANALGGNNKNLKVGHK